MTDILFRGKPNNSSEMEVFGDWVKGDLRREPSGSTFIGFWNTDSEGKAFHCDIEVIPETVGQLTGVADKDGKKIYEGDILIDDSWYKTPVHKVRSEPHPLSEDQDAIREEGGPVERVEKDAMLAVKSTGPNHHTYLPLSGSENWKVVGNIHDNPNMLKP